MNSPLADLQADPASSPSVRRALSASPLFGVLDTPTRIALLAHCSTRKLERDDVVFRAGDSPTSAIVVIRGRIACTIDARGERSWLRAVLGPGGTWGLPSAIDGEPYACTARALASAVVLEIPTFRVHELMEQDRRFAMTALRLVTSELRRIVQYARDVTLYTVRHRLAAYLLARVDDGGRVRIQVAQARIACEIGTVREVVARLLRAFEREGLISRDGRMLQILRPDLLAVA